MRKSINVNDKNYEAIRVYAVQQGVTITTAINQAIEHFLLGRVMYDSMKDLIEDRLSKLSLKTIDTSHEKKGD
jgi:hypothetical protein